MPTKKANMDNIRLRRTKSPSADEVRHSLSHLLAAAVLKKYPDTKLGIGPVIENGFYYDFLFKKPITPEILSELENYVKNLIKTNLTFKEEKITPTKAKKLFTDQPFKMELINEYVKDKKPLSIYTTGDKKSAIFVDLCKGGHVKNTQEIHPDAFKLTHLAGAYWRGSEKNQMLTRIYGLAFETKQELDEYLKFLEEAEKRDHRKIGKDLDLFSFHGEGAGFPFWHPNGMIIYNQLINFISKQNEKRGYGEVKTPPILNKNLWVASGHWDKFKENMYFTEIDGQEFAIKPMNCPGGILIYNENMRSYRDLPLRYSEFGLVHRHELSGVLHGLFRVRAFTQDDAHSFCAPEQLGDEISGMVDYALDVYKTFGFNKYEIFIATKPEKYIGDNKAWKKATDALAKALKDKKIDYKIKDGEGAFYGPKIEFNIKDALNRNWQLGTIQVDFSMPARLGATYTDTNNEKKNPVMVHRAILGSLERFIGILIEHYAGAFPFWLSPIQITVLPIGEKHLKVSADIKNGLKKFGFRTEIDDSNETLGKKIRNAEMKKIPYIIVIGDKEIEAQKIAVRERGKKEIEAISLEKFIENCRNLTPKF